MKLRLLAALSCLIPLAGPVYAATSATTTDTNGYTVTVATNKGSVDNLALAAKPSFAPTNYTYVGGFFTFDITGLTPGDTAVVTMTLYSAYRPDSYIKCTASNCAAVTSASFSDNVVTLTLTDGNSLSDMDGAANGTIHDPGAPAKSTSSDGTGGYGSDGGGGGYGDGGALELSTLMAALLLARLRRRR
jgi:hypothetical protein